MDPTSLDRVMYTGVTKSDATFDLTTQKGTQISML